MAEIHVATSGPLVSDLVAAVVAEFDEWSDHAARQAAAICPGDTERAARFALAEVRADLQDHVQIKLAVALASHGVTA